MTKSVLGTELKEKLVKGIKEISEAVICTLGPSGRNVMIRNDDGSVKITKDGVTVANAFRRLEDPVEDFAVQLIKQVSRNSAKKVGDGTTTSTLISYVMCTKGLEEIKKDTNAVEVKRGIDKSVKIVVDYLRKLSKPVVDKEQFKQVATISANNDESVGVLISTALDKVGKDGLVTLEESKTGETYLETVEGILVDRGYKSPYLVTDPKEMQAVLNEPYILLYNGRISVAEQLIPLFEYVTFNQKSVLVVAEDIDDQALATIIVNKARGTIKICAIKAPGLGEMRTHLLEDIAVVTGGKVLSKEKGDNIDKMKPTDYEKVLGKARTITVTKDDTTIVDGKGTSAAINDRLLDIKSQLEKAKSDYEREKLQERIGKMVGGVAIIAVGGLSEVELKEKKDRVEDALYATKAAIEEGVLPGGGIAYLNAHKELLKQGSFDTSDQEIGRQIVLLSLLSPFQTMLLNAGINPDKYLYKKRGFFNSWFNNKRELEFGGWYGYDIRTMSKVFMEQVGILDATKVVITAIENAASVAGAILTTEAGVFEEKEEEKQQDYSPFA